MLDDVTAEATLLTELSQRCWSLSAIGEAGTMIEHRWRPAADAWNAVSNSPGPFIKPRRAAVDDHV
jgi:hypothetical protein